MWADKAERESSRGMSGQSRERRETVVSTWGDLT